MTVNPRVNPKKLRPYDEPPKGRRTLIPDTPDSAATGFLIAAALWLALAGGLGVLAIGMRIVSIEFSFPLLFGFEFELNERRVEYAFVNATAYGWLTNAGFAAVAFMTPRLLGRRLSMEKLLFLGLVAWNMALMGGLALLYVLDLGPHSALTAFPWFVDGGLATGALIVTSAFFATAATSLRTGYVSLWFAAIALLSVLGLMTLNAGLGLLELILGLDALPAALASAFIERAMATVWLLGMAYATLHYIVPRAVGQPLVSGGLAMLTWLTWLALAPASALAVLVDPSVPFIFTTLGAVATMLLIVPAALAVGNLVATMQGRWTLLFGTGAPALAIVSLAFLLGTSLLEAIGALRGVDALVGGTEWHAGVWIWGMYGAFTLAAFALADHALPRMLRRAWGGGFLSVAQLWLVFGGATIAGLALMGGGLAEGSLLAQGTAADAIGAELMIYRAIALAGFGLVALAGLAMITTMFLMYTSARPIEYAAPGQPATVAAGH
ncbi:MAG: cbb3-type cytochrome c oxidase subunit I [Chloroflexi bacterium]|nr:cbb3-type cytochrome c oxidase subunit I [Chloroflexota bacterium]